jgi:hypothetical protein
VATVGLAACDTSATDSTDTSIGNTATTTSVGDGSVIDALTAVQSQVADLAQDIQSSAAADELGDAWASLQADVAAATAAVQDTGSVDAAELQDGIDDFQSALDSLGEEAGTEVQAGWSELRNLLSGLVS